MQNYELSSLEIGGKLLRFKMDIDPDFCIEIQKKMEKYQEVSMGVVEDKVLQRADLVYNFLLENNIPTMDMITPIAPAIKSSADINPEILTSCEKSLEKLYALDYLTDERITEIWKEISTKWYDSTVRLTGYRCSDVMQISLAGIHYVAPGILDIRRNMMHVFNQHFDNNVIAGIATMFFMEYICPYSVMTGVMGRMILQYYLRMPGVQVWKELYMNSHEYRSVFLGCTHPDQNNVVDISEYFEYMCNIILSAYDRYAEKTVALTEEEKEAYNLLLKKAEKSSYVLPAHIVITSLRLSYKDGIAMLNKLGMRGYIEFTDSNNIVIYNRR